MYSIEQLPPEIDFGTVVVLKELASARRCLAELEGICRSIPSQGIPINTLSLREAKDSSEIENIVTTHDELFRVGVSANPSSPAIREMQNRASALHCDFGLIQKRGMLTNDHILTIQAELEKGRAGFHRQSGTMLKSGRTDGTVYTPPQHTDDIIHLMGRLEAFIDDDNTEKPIDPLIRVALLHYQFESIHLSYDGNGGIDGIINVLYLVLTGLLDIPVLYLGRYLVRNRSEYYRLLQHVHDTGEWEGWLLYILETMEQTAKDGIDAVQRIHQAVLDCRHRVRQNFSFCSQDLINHLFSHPYAKIDFLMRTLNVSRPNVAKYLDELTEGGFLYEEKIGRSNYYINIVLMKTLLPQETAR